MPSPFPGMNPYLENDDVWQDFHDSMIPAMRDALIALIGPEYIIKIEHQLYIHEPSAEQRFLLGKADIGLAQPRHYREDTTATATISSPQMGDIPTVEFQRHLYVEIRDKKRRERISVLELLSPTNKKPGPDREQYLAKRGMLLKSDTNLVEIDLLRAWPRIPVENVHSGDYCIVVSRAQDRPRVNFWPIGLREPLPGVPIPLRPGEPNVILELQAVLHGVYDRAGYGRRIYSDAPTPPLRPDDAVWANAILELAQSEKV